jgi:hypothetical protein
MGAFEASEKELSSWAKWIFKRGFEGKTFKAAGYSNSGTNEIRHSDLSNRTVAIEWRRSGATREWVGRHFVVDGNRSGGNADLFEGYSAQVVVFDMWLVMRRNLCYLWCGFGCLEHLAEFAFGT